MSSFFFFSYPLSSERRMWKKEFIEVIKQPVIITYGSILKLEYRNESNQLHKTFGPATIHYHENGQPWWVTYRIDDKLISYKFY